MLLATILSGCLADVTVDVDPDKDGLADAGEAALGSDPGNPDSDDDGFNDGDEAAENTNPMDAEDHPYLGGWKIGACRDDIEPTGQAEGEVAGDFELMDQFDEKVSLHDFCDRVVLMVFAAFW